MAIHFFAKNQRIFYRGRPAQVAAYAYSSTQVHIRFADGLKEFAWVDVSDIYVPGINEILREIEQHVPRDYLEAKKKFPSMGPIAEAQWRSMTAYERAGHVLIGIITAGESSRES